MFDNVRLEKEQAIARFNRITKLRQFFEVLFILGLIWWSSPPLRRAASACALDFSTYLLNHHVVFLIGNTIIASLFLLCRHSNDAAAPSSASGDDLYNDYVMHSEAATAAAVHLRDSVDLPPTDGEEENEKQKHKQIVVCGAEEKMIMTAAIPQCDDVAVAIEKATRQIKRFQRTQSERLKREIRPALRRSESQNRRNSVSCGERLEAAEIERLSSDEFRRTVDEFIDKHWCRKKTKQIEFDDYENYQLMKLA
ncbi:hypothetical protein C2S53_004115 [Perilla frutescens var. hirtella]|uniref:DUF4408 domain-containing protein n=1 Tax=Perilla frutescens var. hirtella TaxID=608512 RepID=A0AAD4PC54_PERFH|nr:hypothetical protein C2S53_004115 [Perilla frutescens var. hirtella]